MLLPTVTVSTTDDGFYVGTTGTPIQDAIDSLQTSGGTVLVRAGTYSLSTVLTLYDNITLRGEGPATVLKLAAAANIEMVKNEHQGGGGTNTNIEIRDLKLDGGTGSASDKHGVSFTNASSCRFVNLLVSDVTEDGIYMSTCSDMDVIGCQVNDCGRNGIAYGGAAVGTGVRVLGCTLDGNTHAGIDLEPVQESLIANCIARNAPTSADIGAGIVVVGEEADPYRRGNVVNGCIAIDNDGVGFRFDHCQGVLITGCVSARNEMGIYAVTSLNAHIEGNSTYGNVNAGILVDTDTAYSVVAANNSYENGDYGIHVVGDFGSITGNVCRNNSLRQIDVRDGIRITASRCSLSGNQAIDSAADTTKDLSSNASSGQKVVVLDDTVDLFPSMYVTVSDDTPQSEDRQIDTVDSSTQITLTANLTNSYTTAQNAKVTGRASQAYGIKIPTSGNTNNVIVANVAKGNASGQISDSGTGTVTANNITS